jgi:hypothetical protein
VGEQPDAGDVATAARITLAGMRKCSETGASSMAVSVCPMHDRAEQLLFAFAQVQKGADKERLLLK